MEGRLIYINRYVNLFLIFIYAYIVAFSSLIQRQESCGYKIKNISVIVVCHSFVTGFHETTSKSRVGMYLLH